MVWRWGWSAALYFLCGLHRFSWPLLPWVCSTVPAPCFEAFITLALSSGELWIGVAFNVGLPVMLYLYDGGAESAPFWT